MNLATWAASKGLTVQTHRNGCKFVIPDNNQDIGNIYFLDDYCVSSISCGVYWLVERMTPLNSENVLDFNSLDMM